MRGRTLIFCSVLYTLLPTGFSLVVRCLLSLRTPYTLFTPLRLLIGMTDENSKVRSLTPSFPPSVSGHLKDSTSLSRLSPVPSGSNVSSRDLSSLDVSLLGPLNVSQRDIISLLVTRYIDFSSLPS